MIGSERLDPLRIARMNMEFSNTGGNDALGIEGQFSRSQGNFRMILA